MRTETNPVEVPTNNDAEIALIGCVFFDSSVAAKANRVEPRDFYEPNRAQVWSAVLFLADKEPDTLTDMVLFKTEMKRRMLWDSCGCESLMQSILAMRPAPELWESYALEVLEASNRRRVIKAAHDAMAQAHDPFSDIGDVGERFAGELTIGTTAPPSVNADEELGEELEAMIAGQREAIPFDRFPILSDSARALIPATVTILCGQAGATKSFFILQHAAAWHRAGYKVAVYELEETRKFHMLRVLAQVDNNAWLTNSDWVKAHADETREAHQRHAAFERSFGQCITVQPKEQCNYAMMADWVKDRCRAGCDLIAIDPISALDGEGKPWIEDRQFLMSVKQSVERYGARAILVTHPKNPSKGDKAFGLERIAGGSAYPRFSQCVLWFTAHENERDVTVKRFGADDGFTQINRSVRILKARNAMGSGREIGMRFSNQSLTFEEVGIVVADKE